jgi:hypothetical protein
MLQQHTQAAPIAADAMVPRATRVATRQPKLTERRESNS